MADFYADNENLAHVIFMDAAFGEYREEPIGQNARIVKRDCWRHDWRRVCSRCGIEDGECECREDGE